MDRDSRKLKKVSVLDRVSGIIQMIATYIDGAGEHVIILTQDGRVTFYKHLNDFEYVEDLRFPTDDGLAFAPSFIDATEEYHVILQVLSKKVIC